MSAPWRTAGAPASWAEFKVLADAVAQFIDGHDELSEPGTEGCYCMTPAQSEALALARSMQERFDAMFADLAG